MQLGIVFALLAYTTWGLLPIYMKAIAAASPAEVLLHRMVWSAVFMTLVLGARRQWGWLGEVLGEPRRLLRFCVTAGILAVNWTLYIWAVNNGHVIDSSLGYFINPLVNVLLGALVFKERLRRAQWLAVAIAASGVLWLTWAAGSLPWIGLWLAITFAAYGMLRKTASLGALEGLALENYIVFPFALIAFGWMVAHDQAVFVEGPPQLTLLLLAAGPITAIPLLWFAAAARRIPFSLLGLLQYIGPTLTLTLGVVLYNEPFTRERLVGFALIWIALAVYSLEALAVSVRNRATAPDPATVPAAARSGPAGPAAWTGPGPGASTAPADPGRPGHPDGPGRGPGLRVLADAPANAVESAPAAHSDRARNP